MYAMMVDVTTLFDILWPRALSFVETNSDLDSLVQSLPSQFWCADFLAYQRMMITLYQRMNRNLTERDCIQKLPYQLFVSHLYANGEKVVQKICDRVDKDNIVNHVRCHTNKNRSQNWTLL